MSQKIPVGILGATGSVGQKFVELLAFHPWFEVTALAASDRSAGKSYGETVHWNQNIPIPSRPAGLLLLPCKPDLPCKVVFSALDATVAGDIETEFARAGYAVFSNARNHRMDSDVPLLIPEINAEHIQLIAQQQHRGMILTNPNCSTIGLVVSLKPLLDRFGIEEVYAVTFQAISGAGYPGIAANDILDNVIPFISGEEEKLETEPQKILGKYENGTIHFADIQISAQCNRVPVQDGHLECVSVRLKKKTSLQEIKNAWMDFMAEPQRLELPSAPRKPIYYFTEQECPQPKLHRNLEKGMAIAIGRLRECPLLDYKFVILSHNTIRGAAGNAILTAELMVAEKKLPVQS
jgi:aspartate-semialdehyde dehydrogenase